MAWRSSGRTNDELVNNLKDGGLIESSLVERAMKAVDRRLFTHSGSGGHLSAGEAYADQPQPIGFGATISAPHMHAMCLEQLRDKLKAGGRALDVGSGSGYLVACMAEMVGESGVAVGVEHIQELVDMSKKSLMEQYGGSIPKQITVLQGDGRLGHQSLAPYDCIHVGAAAPNIPQALLDQLAPGGRLVIPVGTWEQQLEMIEKSMDTDNPTFKRRVITGVRYVPLTDEQKQRKGEL